MGGQDLGVGGEEGVVGFTSESQGQGHQVQTQMVRPPERARISLI